MALSHPLILSLDHSNLINLFINIRLNIFPVRSMLSFTFVPDQLWGLSGKVSVGSREKLFLLCWPSWSAVSCTGVEF